MAPLAYRDRCAKSEHCGGQKTKVLAQTVFITDSMTASFKMARAEFFSSVIFIDIG
jgi:hypothetical protein